MEAPHAITTFGPYRLEALIRRSATASVYHATDSRHGGRAVALKLFAPHLCADAAFPERFRRDAGLLSALRQPHVVPIHTYGVHDGVVFLDMRFVSGPSLAEVRRTDALDARRAGAIADQLAAATGAIRASGLGDRAVTAEDVLLSGPPGREFVHLVGLGLGRPPANAPVDVLELLGPTAPRPVRRRWRPVVAVAATFALLVAAAVVWASASALPAPLAPGQLAAMAGGGAAVAAATTTLDGLPVAVTAAGGEIRTWNLSTGTTAAPTIPVDARVVATAAVDGSPVIVSRGVDQLVRVHRLADGEELGRPIGTAEPPPPVGGLVGAARSVATVEVGGRPAVVAAQPTGPGVGPFPDLGFAVWTLPSGEPIGQPVTAGPTASLDLATATLDGTAAVVALTDRAVIRTFDAATGAPIGGPITPGVPVNVIDVVDRGSGPIVLAACADNSIRLFELRTGAPVGPVLRGHTGSVGRVAAVRSGDRDLLVSTAFASSSAVQAEIRFWDLDGGTPVGPVLVGHPVAAMLAAATVDGRGVLVTSTADGAAVWDVAALIGGTP